MMVDTICGEPCVKGLCDAKADCANRGYCWHRKVFGDPNKVRKLYVIGSLRNPNVPKVAQLLREKLKPYNFEVFDDWYAAGPEADDYWKQYEQERGRSYRAALCGHAAKNVFAFDKKHLDSASHVLLVLPAGKSGHLELGYCIGKGKHSFILLDPEDVRWDVMYQFADIVTDNVEDIIDGARRTL